MRLNDQMCSTKRENNDMDASDPRCRTRAWLCELKLTSASNRAITFSNSMFSSISTTKDSPSSVQNVSSIVLLKLGLW